MHDHEEFKPPIISDLGLDDFVNHFEYDNAGKRRRYLGV